MLFYFQRNSLQIKKVKNLTKSQNTKPWTATIEDLPERFDVNPGKGLENDEVQRCQKKFGKIQLQIKEGKSVLEIMVDQLKSLIILLMVIYAMLSFSLVIS